MLGCVAAGMGYALLPRVTVEAHQQRFGVHYLELPKAIAQVDTYFAAAEPETWTPALARFAETLREIVIPAELEISAP